ncbi:MAG: 4-hydroxythreonine-4-phosphate dehydrogenase PdxA [Phycisphaerales bacterium]|nr:4-hydroxythreonine-4-phosphate dehydrogenase PdxA [Phycisphaerales bacterium]
METKPIIGFTTGDLNGIGIEVLIKSLNASSILELCTPLVFANPKVINFYRRTIKEDTNMQYHVIKDINKVLHKQINVYSCWEDDVIIKPGNPDSSLGKYAFLSLQQATDALLAQKIHALVTAPIDKSNMISEQFKFIGHTPYFKDVCKAKDVLLMMVSENIKLGLVTEHIPIARVAEEITKELIVNKLNILQKSLEFDFGIIKPKIAVLALNPHAGDKGLLGKEESQIILPAIKEARTKHNTIFGPYVADTFFTRNHHEQFDGILAMYHDQGLIPFKTLAQDKGIDFTAGLPIIRTTPAHGTAYDIAGKGIAFHDSMLQAIFYAIDIINYRKSYIADRANPLNKSLSQQIISNSVDEMLRD